jgi:hypothetical protein
MVTHLDVILSLRGLLSPLLSCTTEAEVLCASLHGPFETRIAEVSSETFLQKETQV